jgi:hypothetical protein
MGPNDGATLIMTSRATTNCHDSSTGYAGIEQWAEGLVMAAAR